MYNISAYEPVGCFCSKADKPKCKPIDKLLHDNFRFFLQPSREAVCLLSRLRPIELSITCVLKYSYSH